MSTSPLGKVILEVLKVAHPEWLTRSAIAQRLHRPKDTLNPHDVKTLDKLAEQELVETSERKDGPVKKTKLYRFVPQPNNKKGTSYE